MRDHNYPWLLPGIAWALCSLVVGLTHARNHGWTGIWIAAALVGAGVFVALAFVIISSALAWVLLRMAESQDRSSKPKDGGTSEG